MENKRRKFSAEYKTRVVLEALTERRMLVKKKHKLSVKRRCELLGVHRSGLYYKPKEVSGLSLELMRVMDEQYLKTPFYGVPRMWDWLRKKGYRINKKRIERIYKLMEGQ